MKRDLIHTASGVVMGIVIGWALTLLAGFAAEGTDAHIRDVARKVIREELSHFLKGR